MKDKIKVTIGIPAYNEEANIDCLLDSLIKQDTDGYILEQIVVLGDGCDDKTEEIVNKLAKENTIIKPKFDGRRLGKQERINTLFSKSDSDIIVFLDADVVLGSSDTILNLIKCFDSDTGLVSGNDQPVEPTSFFERIFSCIENFWYHARKHSNNGNNIHNQRGRLFAVSKDFAKTLRIPKNAIDDYYIYLDCMKKGFKFNFAEDAVVYYNTPSTINDFMSQSLRGAGMVDNALDHFGEDIKKSAFCTTAKDKLVGIATVFVQDPFFTVIAVFFVFLSKLNIRTHEQVMEEGSWETIESTKKKVRPTPARSGRI